jgi:outer membrane protein, heavy metal efflux system
MASRFSRTATLVASLACGIGLVSPAWAADSTPQPPTLSALGLADLERIALQNNPTMAQAAAQVDSSRSKAIQAGLYPNPTIGYASDQVGAAGTLGETQGAFVQQTIVTAGKLRLSRAKFNQEAYEAEIRVIQQQYRVLNGVRTGYYELLALSRMIDLHRRILANAEESLLTHQEMFNTGQANRADVLMARVAVNDAKIELRGLENRYTAHWQQLTALIGSPELPVSPLKGRLELEGAPLEWASSLVRLLQESPELLAARAHVVHDQISLQREKAEPVPNIQLQGVTGYNFETRNATAGVQVGFKIPVWDRNQGTIHQVQADLGRSQAEVRRIELSLRQRLAEVFNNYQTALESCAIYRESSVPQVTQAYELQLEMYKQRRTAWPQVVMLQRNMLEVDGKYTQSLLELRKAEVAISGLLLSDGLGAPVSALPDGHLEATPRPR